MMLITMLIMMSRGGGHNVCPHCYDDYCAHMR